MISLFHIYLINSQEVRLITWKHCLIFYSVNIINSLTFKDENFPLNIPCEKIKNKRIRSPYFILRGRGIMLNNF